MKEIKIDEEHINVVSNSYANYIQELIMRLEQMTNKEADIFDRYMSFIRLSRFIPFINAYNECQNNLIISGFDLNHSLLNTEKAKKAGWDRQELEKNSFFVNSEETKENTADVTSEFLKAFREKAGNH